MIVLLNPKDIARYLVILVLAGKVLIGSASAALMSGARQADGTQPSQKASHQADSTQASTPKPDKSVTSERSSAQNGDKKAPNKKAARKREEPSDKQANGANPPPRVTHRSASTQASTPRPDKNSNANGSSSKSGEKNAPNKTVARKRKEPSDKQAGVRKVSPPGERAEDEGNGRTPKRRPKTGSKAVKPKGPTSSP